MPNSDTNARRYPNQQIEDAAIQAALLSRRKYNSTELPATVMCYDLVRAAARDRGLDCIPNIDYG
jgi:hypothetical protein